MAGTLLGTAIGDALGLATEGMTAAAIARRYGVLDRYRLFGRTGFVSDDTEQSALVADALVRDPLAPERALRRSMLGWFARLPWGIGWGTLRACVRIALGFRTTGVASAGNGAAMRAAVAGVFFADDAEARARVGRALAEVTHTDRRAVEGALFVGELAAMLARDGGRESRAVLAEAARRSVHEPALRGAIDDAIDLASSGASTGFAARRLGTSGYVVESVAFATYVLLRWGGDPRAALREAASAGGDTDTNAAIVGAWVGALHGASALPSDLIQALHDGPFGRTHLRALASALAASLRGEHVTPPRFSWVRAFARNLALYPVVFVSGVRVALSSA